MKRLCLLLCLCVAALWSGDKPGIIGITPKEHPQADWEWTITLDRKVDHDTIVVARLRTRDENGNYKRREIKFEKGQFQVTIHLPEFERIEGAYIQKR